ncbi:hypothetical protein GGF43_002925 [Coemansia sp. RSA 2618]|nr:hypothetical protein GGF43_002925 [Coemansia sp. RSA 2618]
MSPKKAQWRIVEDEEQESAQASDAVDEWAPADYEEGLSLSQALRGSRLTPKRNRFQSPPPAKRADKNASKRLKTKVYVDIVQPSHRSRPGESASIEQHSPEREELTEQQKAIADMFADSEPETGADTLAGREPATGAAAGSDDQDVVVESWVDGSNSPAAMAHNAEPTGGMDFMDKESAENFRRLLELNQRTKRRAFEKESRRTTRRPLRRQSSDAYQPPSGARLPMPANERSPAVEQITQASSLNSADDLPDDPLDFAGPSSSTRAKRQRGALLRRAERRHRISDSESNSGDASDMLDSGAIIEQRLRTRRAVSTMRSRFEQARRNVHRRVYESDSDTESGSEDRGVEVIDSYGEPEEPAGAPIDMPETDSEPECRRKSAVLVIHDSSDDVDDFISDPDDPPSLPPISRLAPRAADDKMNKFLSAFEPRRQKHMKRRRLLRASGGAGKYGGLAESPKVVRGYSEELDEDLADFIVDDDVDDEIIAHTQGSPSVVRNSAPRSDSDKSVGPSFGMDRPHGALALLPEEFSQLDLQTSFKTYVQYLVYWICSDRQKPRLSDDVARYFYLGYITVARVVDSVEQSVVASSVWLDDFRADLYRFPDYSIACIDAVPGCQACHFRTNRTATFRVTLSGTPYGRKTLAPPQGGAGGVETSGSETSGGCSDAGSVVSVDSDGHSLAAPAYNVGRTCKLRSEICHRLHHYFYRLANEVEAALELLVAGDQPAGADGAGDTEPGDLVAKLEAQGTTGMLYDEFKELVDSAKAQFTS